MFLSSHFPIHYTRSARKPQVRKRAQQAVEKKLKNLLTNPRLSCILILASRMTHHIARVAQWWSIALPRRGSRVRIPSRALSQESNDSCFFLCPGFFRKKRKSVIRFRITLRRQVNHIGLYSPTQAANRIQGTFLVPATLSVLYTNNVTELVS